MEKKVKKDLVIITGVTGAIGSALLEQYGQRKNTVIVGITRKSQTWKNFINKKTGKIYCGTLLCAVEFEEKEVKNFIAHIDVEEFARVTFIHCVGDYQFEVDSVGNFTTENDKDGDGINDLVKFLSYDLFKWFAGNLMRKTKSQLDFVIFGSLADKYEPQSFKSWWQTMKKTEHFMSSVITEKIGFFRFDISSVLCPHELITRPFVFTHTDADQTSWLSPSKLASEVIRALDTSNGGFHKNDMFEHWDGFSSDYYQDEKIVPRRLLEISQG